MTRTMLKRLFRNKRFFRNKKKSVKPGRRLGMAGWWLFLTALALPAVWVSVLGAGAWYWGWQCFQIVLMFLWDGMKGVEPPLLFLGFALANLLTLFAPLFLRQKSRSPWLLRGLSVYYLVNAASALYLFAGGWGDGLGPGYYAWALSFGLIGIGCAKLSVQPRTETVPPAAAPRPKTPEERAAERELLEYLG